MTASAFRWLLSVTSFAPTPGGLFNAIVVLNEVIVPDLLMAG